MKKKIIIVTLAIVLLDSLVRSEIPKPGNRRNIKGRVTVQVIDDDKLPVKNADVELAFIHSDTSDGFTTVAGSTDTNGCFTAEEKSNGRLNYYLSKDGYYKTEGVYKFYKAKNADVKNDRWLPWNLTIPVTLKEMKTPIPMYAKKVALEVPQLDKAFGFDLEKGDWVAPFGKGVAADFIFNVSGIYNELLDRDSKMLISFENESDGMQGILYLNGGSRFDSIYNAPLTGYQTNYIYEKKISRIGSQRVNPDPRTDKYYVFRVRTKTDETGEIVSANYGKIYGDIQCDFRNEKAIGVYFTYYFNPDGTRNLEFDPKRNLFKNLSAGEGVTRP